MERLARSHGYKSQPPFIRRREASGRGDKEEEENRRVWFICPAGTSRGSYGLSASCRVKRLRT